MPEDTKMVLLVEDDPDHAELILRSLQNHRVAIEVCHLSDGETALDYLFRRRGFAELAARPHPHLILLDLRLPRIDGMEVLREIKASEELKDIPVVILSTSQAEGDVDRAYRNRANSYLVKPMEFDEFVRLIDELGSYWLSLNCKPEDRQEMSGCGQLVGTDNE